VKPLLGRTFDAADDRRRAPRTLILSHGFWQRQFGGDPQAVGRVLSLSEGTFTVVGVMPPAFRYPAARTHGRRSSPIWRRSPRTRCSKSSKTARWASSTSWGGSSRQATLDAARADLDRVIAQRSGATGRGRVAHSRLTMIADDLLGSAQTSMWLLIAAVALCCCSCCRQRRGPSARAGGGPAPRVRGAAGARASRWNLARQLLCESLLALAAGDRGGGRAAAACVPIAQSWIPGELPRIGDAAINGRALAFTAVIGLTAAVLSWIVPAPPERP